MVQHIPKRSNVPQAEEGSLYPALQKMFKAKLVKAEWDVSASNRRVRTYQITDSSLFHLERQVSSFKRRFEGIMLAHSPGQIPSQLSGVSNEQETEYLPSPDLPGEIL
jgi:PadR family transcriptional regulator, regulatory protein PadR